MGEGFPLWTMASMAWEGWEPLREWICLSLFLCSQILPFHRFLYSRRSVTPIGLKFWHDLYPEISFLVAKEGHQPPYGWPTRVRGAPPCLVATSGTVSRGFFFPKIIYIPKKSPSVFIPFGLRLIWIFCETKNMQQTGTRTRHWINMLVRIIV